MDTLNGQVEALTKLFNGEIQRAWGTPSEPGSERAIYRICSLIVDVCRRLIEWEECVRFMKVPAAFDEVWKLLSGVGSRQMRHVFELPGWLSNIFSSENPTGTHHFSLKCDFPDGWADQCERALHRAIRSM